MNAPEDNPDPILPGLSRKTYLERLDHYLALTFSIPERSARAAAALVGGSTLLLSKTLIPQSIKTSNSYRFTLGMFQTFLVRNVAGMEQLETDTELGEHFLHRKLLGTSLETAGLLTMHLSPVWVFAIASDAAKGGQVFLQRLVGYLKENEVIPSDSNPESLEQVLQSIALMSQQGATAIDMPPLTLEEVTILANELRQSTAQLAHNSNKLLPDFEAIWNRITLVARQENLTVEQVMGILSVSAASVSRSGLGAANAVGRTGAVILDEMILNDYKQTLSSIHEAGAFTYLSDHMRPFMDSALSHFDFTRETRSEQWYKSLIRNLTGKLKTKK